MYAGDHSREDHLRTFELRAVNFVIYIDPLYNLRARCLANQRSIIIMDLSTEQLQYSPIPSSENAATIKEPVKDQHKEQNSELTKLYSKALADGEQRAQKQFAKNLQKLGFEMLEGQDPLTAVAEKFQQFQQGEEQLRLRSEQQRTRVQELEQRLQDKERALNEYVTQTELSSALGKHDLVNPQAVMTLFTSEYQISKNGSALQLTKNGQEVYNDETAQPVTLEEALDGFLHANPYLLKAGARGVSATPLTGSPQDKIAYYKSLPIDAPERRQLAEKLIAKGDF